MNEQFRQALRQEDTVLFVGSGVSCWAGLPSWPKLLNQLADFIGSVGGDADLVRREIDHDLLQAAGYGFDQLTPAQAGEFLREACLFGKAIPQDIHRVIVSLGPRCFITTNFDDLLEQSLRRWRSSQRFRTVTNRQPFEEADIIQARAADFVFKPHGDLGDIESIVLTRERYRKLLEGGEWRHALETLKTLLVTRRVIYVGFGLRDPDFLLLRDVLANTWKGGNRDHYAIMADASGGEISYWRKNYGIHLIPYQTISLPNGTRDHRNLKALLEEACTLIASRGARGAEAPDTVIALLRHAGGLTRVQRIDPEFPLRVHSTLRPGLRRSDRRSFLRYDGWLVNKFLDDGPERAVLIGSPGAGKTYALCNAAARFAQKFYENCMAQPSSLNRLTVPVFVDLKLYSGSIAQLIENNLPSGLTLKTLTQRFSLRLFVDSFNEMPREHWEKGQYEADFAEFLRQFPNLSLIIGSRTEDGLSKLGLPVFELDEVDEEFVLQELPDHPALLIGRFERELRALLQKPFFFRLAISGNICLTKDTHPRDLYESFFKSLSKSFAPRFGKALDLEKALRAAAYEAINQGIEAFPLRFVLQSVSKELQAAGISDISEQSVANWLVSKDVLLPYSSGRVAFFHQSITEFLAATELARIYLNSPSTLRDKLKYTRWDQALFLTLSCLPAEAANRFLADIIVTDLRLALCAVKYLEEGRDVVVSSLLQAIIDNSHPEREDIGRLETALRYNVPLQPIHEPLLREILQLRNLLGAAAAGRVVELCGESVKDELIDSIFDNPFDYNYCTGVARELRQFITPNDAAVLVDRAVASWREHAITEENEDKFHLPSALSQLFEDLESSCLREAFLAFQTDDDSRAIRQHMVCEAVWHHKTIDAFLLAAELVAAGEKHAAFALQLIGKWEKDSSRLPWDCFNVTHIDNLIACGLDPKHGKWVLDALTMICRHRSDLAVIAEEKAATRSGLFRACLLYAIDPNNSNFVFDTFKDLARKSERGRHSEPLYLLDQVELDWHGHEQDFVTLLKLGDNVLIRELLEAFLMGGSIGEIQIGSLEWLLTWLGDDTDPENMYWIRDRLAGLLAEHLAESERNALVAEFNRDETPHRSVLANYVLWAWKDLTTDQFSESAVDYLIASLKHEGGGFSHFRGHLLGFVATEPFIVDRLLPLLNTDDSIFQSNLKQVLHEAGRRHGRRYVTDDR